MASIEIRQLVKDFHDRLRGQNPERLGRDAEPTAGVIDAVHQD